MTGKKLLGIALLLFVGATTVLAGAPSRAGADDATASDGPHGVLTADVDSYAAHVEYDIPLPVGAGTIADVSGEIRSSAAGENSKGVAASPSALDPVVGGKFSDPQGTGHPVNRYPQTECFYPGSLLDTRFSFPTDERPEVNGAPAIGYSTARCAAGPLVDLHARGGSVGDDKTIAAAAGPALDANAFTSDALARPLKGALQASTTSQASKLTILNGVITVGSVVAKGESQITGQPGGGASTAAISISDINAGGVVFSLESASVNGNESVQLIVGGQPLAIDTSAAKSVIDAANAGLKPQGCSIAPMTSPNQFPQGFLFARPEPEVGVAADGSTAGSYRGGLLITCDIPKSLSEPSTFSPQRAQILLGFAYTGTAVKPGDDNLQIGGFNTGDLLTGATDSSIGLAGPLDAALGGPAATTPAVVAAPPPAVEQAASALTSTPATILPRHLANSTKWLLGLLSLALWFPLTHLGARRLRLALADGAET
jgi:hypothetical protein